MAVDERVPPVSEVNTIIYGALARAHKQADIPLPEQIQLAGLRQLVQLKLRSYNPAYREIFNEVDFTDIRGQPQRVTTIARAMWYPWSVEALTSWLQPAGSFRRIAIEERLALERSLGHLVVTLSRDMLSDTLTAPPWLAAEVYYGLGSISQRSRSPAPTR
jgi:hypothetical protein